MIIKVALLAALAMIFAYAVSQRRRAPVPAAIMSCVASAGCVFVVAPEMANRLANDFGVGRGADLILYCFVVVMLAAVFNIHLRLRSEHETITALARAIAIQNAVKPKATE